MSCAVDWFVYVTGLSRWCCHVHEFNKWVFVQLGDFCDFWSYCESCSYCDFLFFSHCKHNCILCAWLEIFRRGHQVELGCKMGRCMEQVENHWSTSQHDLIPVLYKYIPMTWLLVKLLFASFSTWKRWTNTVLGVYSDDSRKLPTLLAKCLEYSWEQK